jgi:hypothetical protein
LTVGLSGGPEQPSPTIGQCILGGLGWLEEDPRELAAGCHPTAARYADLEVGSILCRKGRHAPPVRMIKLTERREITPYKS